LVWDALLECKASNLFTLYAVFAVGLLLVEYLLLGAHSSFTMNINGRRTVTEGGVQLAQFILPGISKLLEQVFALLAFFGMSDLMTPVMQRGTAEIYLSKPVPRWLILLARVLGHWLALAAALAVTTAAVWGVAGVRTGVWDARFFLGALPTLLVVAIFLCIVALFNVLTGSTSVSGLISLGLLLTASMLRFRDALAHLWDSPAWRMLLRWLYVILPKPDEIADAIPVLIGRSAGPMPWFAIWTSALFACGAVALAVWRFERRDF
jgi:hypothetical protein